MSESQAIQLVTKYIYDRTGKQVHISLVKIVGNVRQSQLLQEAVQIAAAYYRNETIILK